MNGARLSSLTAGWMVTAVVSAVIAVVNTWNIFAEQTALSARHAELQDIQAFVSKIEDVSAHLQNPPLHADDLEKRLQSLLDGIQVTLSVGRKRDIAATALVARTLTISVSNAALSDVFRVLAYVDSDEPALHISNISIIEPQTIRAGRQERWDAKILLTQVGAN